MIDTKYILYSLIFYGISLITPIFYGSNFFGVAALALGWIGVFDPNFPNGFGVPWLANLLYFINLILYRVNLKIRIGLSILTLTCGLFAIGIKEVPVNESGINKDVVVGIGFGIWMLSFLLLLIGQIKELNNKNGGQQRL